MWHVLALHLSNNFDSYSFSLIKQQLDTKGYLAPKRLKMKTAFQNYRIRYFISIFCGKKGFFKKTDNITCTSIHMNYRKRSTIVETW